jgi:predicted PurR-regulated permease PerM
VDRRDPADAVALAESPTAAIAVALAVPVHPPVEGHIVIPKLMGGAVGCTRCW